MSPFASTCLDVACWAILGLMVVGLVSSVLGFFLDLKKGPKDC